MREIELLAPAGNAAIAEEAIKHGADAVYIGPPTHGARQQAANSTDDITRTVDFAHTYGARVYVTVNTIVYENELKAVERMIRDLYNVGVDALIVQDMGILRMDLPPIALHASTQCDIRTPEKARFLQEAGFSQLVLARELSIAEIGKICEAVTIPVEVFVHGALCVSYSGRCGAGYAAAGRSGNRGECPQICRQSFTLKDADGKIIAADKYLLSLRDLKADAHIEELIDAGVSSFKIEGRLKEAGYVKNVTAYYGRRLNDIIVNSNGKYRRSSYGTSEITFTPQLDRSFNRGFTDYRLTGRPAGIASINTPKSLGEKITDISTLKPGDGISYFDKSGEYRGLQVNAVIDGRIIGNRPFQLPKGIEIRRTSSVEWKKLLARDTAKRTLRLDITLDSKGITAKDESGAMVRISHDLDGQPAQKPTDYRKLFEKLGNTPFRLREFVNEAPELFYPASSLTSLRREAVEKLLEAKRMTYPFDYRRPENRDFPYPSKALDYSDNVANSHAQRFYKDHGVKKTEPALELTSRKAIKGKKVMSTRHCILRELGLCLKQGHRLKQPLTLESGALRLLPTFDCSRCEMHISLP